DRRLGDAGAERIDATDDLVAEHAGDRRRIHIRALPGRDVGVVEAERLDGDAYLPGGGLRRRPLLDLEGFLRRAVADEDDGSHAAHIDRRIAGVEPSRAETGCGGRTAPDSVSLAGEHQERNPRSRGENAGKVGKIISRSGSPAPNQRARVAPYCDSETPGS